MRQKELRIGLVCYGGVSLAVYMHGVTKEVWNLARASRGFHGGARPARPSGAADTQSQTRTSRNTRASRSASGSLPAAVEIGVIGDGSAMA